MRRTERDGLVFVAEERVPASYFNLCVENLYSEDIEEMKKEYVEFDITHEWDLYLREIEDEMRDFLSLEEEDVIIEVENLWKRIREEYKN